MGGILGGHPVLCYISIYVDLCAILQTFTAAVPFYGWHFWGSPCIKTIMLHQHIRWYVCKRLLLLFILMGGILGGHPVLCYISIYVDMRAMGGILGGQPVLCYTSIHIDMYTGVSLYYATSTYTLICVQGSACIMLHQYTCWYACKRLLLLFTSGSIVLSGEDTLSQPPKAGSSLRCLQACPSL